MKTKSLTMIVFYIILLLGSTGCNTVLPSPTVTTSPSITVAPTLTLTLTSTLTPTVAPTETPTPIPEKDLQPAYIETIAQAHQDVQVKLSIITDASLESANPSISKIYLNPRFNNYLGENSKDALAHFTTLTFYKLWKSRQGNNQSTSDIDFESYLEQWSQAQNSNQPEDWEKVQINGVWANDLNDGNGYKQQEYTIWPMYTGDPAQVPQGVRAITELGIAYVRVAKMKNIIISPNNNKAGFGYNLDGSIFYVYTWFQGSGQDAGGWNATYIMAFLSKLLINNRGSSSLPEFGGDMELYKLVNRSSNIGSCCYRAALKIDPSTNYERTYNP